MNLYDYFAFLTELSQAHLLTTIMFRLFVRKVTIFRMGTPWGHSVKKVD